MLVRFKFDGAQGFECEMPCPPRMGEFVHQSDEPLQLFIVHYVFWSFSESGNNALVADVQLIRYQGDPRDRPEEA